MVTQLLHLQSCPSGDAHRANAADWAGQSATRGKQDHIFSPTQFFKKMRLSFQVIRIITLFASLQQQWFIACPHKAVGVNLCAVRVQSWLGKLPLHAQSRRNDFACTLGCRTT